VINQYAKRAAIAKATSASTIQSASIISLSFPPTYLAE
jgi:hypothetical protein